MTTHNDLPRLLDLFKDHETAAEVIGNFLSDEFDAPELAPLIMAVVSEPAYEIEDVDVFMFHSYILRQKDTRAKFAKLFADMWEICPIHSCDPEICSSDPESKCEGS